MSITAVLLEGAQRALQYSALLFSLNVTVPAAAQLPPPQAVPAQAAALAIDGPLLDLPLTLTAHHLDVRISGDAAAVRTVLLLRNDTADVVATQYMLPYPARVQRGDQWQALGAAHFDDHCDVMAAASDGDLSAIEAELAEVGEPRPQLQRHDVVVVAPGEQVTVEVQQVVPVSERDGVHRLVLPLPVDRDAPWVPHFSADVLVEAGQPIRRLASSTHEALIDGLGERTALLTVPNGFVYRQTQLAIDFELGAAAPAAAAPLVTLRQPAQTIAAR